MNKQETRSEEKRQGIEQDDNMPTHLTSMHTEQEKKRNNRKYQQESQKKKFGNSGKTAQINMP